MSERIVESLSENHVKAQNDDDPYLLPTFHVVIVLIGYGQINLGISFHGVLVKFGQDALVNHDISIE